MGLIFANWDFVGLFEVMTAEMTSQKKMKNGDPSAMEKFAFKIRTQVQSGNSG